MLAPHSNHQLPVHGDEPSPGSLHQHYPMRIKRQSLYAVKETSGPKENHHDRDVQFITQYM